MFCTACGSKNKADANFCGKCGKLLRDMTTLAPTQPQVQPSVNEDLPRLEIRSRATRFGVMLTAIGLLGLFVMGPYILITEPNEFDKIRGALIGFVGGPLTIWLGRRISRRPVSLVLNQDGIEWITPVGSARIPYRDIEKVGVYTLLRIEFIAFQLKSYDDFIETMSPDYKTYVARTMPFNKIGSQLTAKFIMPGVKFYGPVMKLFGLPNQAEIIADAAKVDTVEASFKLNRKHYGYDFHIPGIDLDRSPIELLKVVEKYRKNYQGGTEANMPILAKPDKA